MAKRENGNDLLLSIYPSHKVSPNNAIKNRFFNLTLTLNINLHLYFSWEQSTKKYSWILIFKINITSLRTRNKFGFVFAALLHKWGRSYNYTGPSHSDECTIYKCISPQPPQAIRYLAPGVVPHPDCPLLNFWGYLVLRSSHAYFSI